MMSSLNQNQNNNNSTNINKSLDNSNNFKYIKPMTSSYQ